MLSNKKSFLTVVSIIILFWSCCWAEVLPIGCPLMLKGHQLKDTELFDGPPENLYEIMPAPGKFLIPFRPPSLWDRYPPATLLCRYKDLDEKITVVLPRSVTVCEFPHYPQVECR
jgi:hypothetical protein